MDGCGLVDIIMVCHVNKTSIVPITTGMFALHVRNRPTININNLPFTLP